MSPIFTSSEIAALNRARAILESGRERATAAYVARDFPGRADAFDMGRLDERCEHGSDAIFDVLNTLNSYGIQELEKAELHYRQAAA